MTGLEFLSVTIGQLIWPIFILIAIWMLRDPIKSLAASPRLKRLKAGPGGLEIELRDELDQAEKELGTGGTPTKEIEAKKYADPAVLDFREEMAELARVSPRAVVTESHVRLERLLRNSVDVPSDGDRRPRYLSVRSLTRAAMQQGLLDRKEARVLDELTDLRNRVAHEPDEVITIETALRYSELALQVAIAIRLASGLTSADGPAL